MEMINNPTLRWYRHADVIAKKDYQCGKQVAAGFPAQLVAQPDWQWPRVPGRVHAGDCLTTVVVVVNITAITIINYNLSSTS